MQPACQNLSIVPGTTYRDTARLMQPAFAYRAITVIAGAPVLLTVPGHGLAGDWPIWVRGVTGMPDINREPVKQTPHRAKFIDASTLEVNALSAEGLNPQGGQLVYKTPVDLTGATVEMRFERAGTELLVLSLGQGLEQPSAGTITRELSPAQTALLTGAWTYTLDVTFSDGAITRYFQGGPAAGRCNG
ncbi:hypothetical protein [Pseudomonas leptonychotis]|uniref:hypothetical protein n=1 Tax=Pseudomonas leptonychotis TaxID=2448482 RepID=UPI0038684FB6